MKPAPLFAVLLPLLFGGCGKKESVAEVKPEEPVAETKPAETGKVDNLVTLLNQYRHIKISINGHASFEGESLYNKLLSDKRANSVKLMIENSGIDSMRLKVNGFGEDQQKYPNIPPSERAKNRRVQFKID